MPNPTTPEPRPQTFFEDRTTKELFYFMGRDPTNPLAEYIFATSAGDHVTRCMTRNMVPERLVEVDPSAQGYTFRNPEEKALFLSHAQTSPKRTVSSTQELMQRQTAEMLSSGPGFLLAEDLDDPMFR